MKKTLRMLCMGILAAVSAVSFAQENVTSKLLNPDAEKGMLGWDVTFVDGGFIWNKQTKGEGKAVGYHGFNNWAFENWRGSGSLGVSAVHQTVSELPNGTYVFGAYAMATNDSWEPSIENIQGVSIFANEQSVPVATHRVEGMNEKWAHAIKFNVATVVEDGKLKVGMQTAADCNTNFVAMDNATLYFFGDMAPEAALEEMAKIDMTATIAKVDTFLKYKMNVDTVAFINAAIEAAATVTAETAAQVDEDLWWGKRQAVKSIAQYATFAQAIEAAKAIAAGEWTDFETTVAALEALNALIAEAEAMYEEATAEKFELVVWADSLAKAAALVELDGCYTLLDVYTEKIDEMNVSDDLGDYTQLQKDKAEDYWLAASTILAEAEEGVVSPITAKAECEKFFAQIDLIIANPIDYAEFPIFLHSSDKVLPNQKGPNGKSPFPVLEGAYEIDYDGKKNLIEYTSQLFRFREPLKSVRFYIRGVGDPTEVDKNGNPHICISGFAMFDELGDTIPLTTENVVSNATENEGQGIPGMLDYRANTFFHSLWRTGTPEAHYIEVTLPEGQYSAFSFKMLSFEDTRSRVFPTELEITYVDPLVTELQKALVAARNLNPTFGSGVGFVNVDPAAYNAALAEGDAVVAKNGASNAEVVAAINKVNAVADQIKEAGIKMPEAGKKYRIISGEPRFFSNQNIMKALTLHTDTIYGDWLWWETAHADSARQEFIVEHYSTHGDRAYYTFKHAQTGLYLGELIDTLGNLVPNRFVFTERVDSFWLKSLGQGQFGIMASDGNSRKQFNMEFHNNGAWSDIEANYGAIKGVKSYIHTWDSNADQSSAWFFREMVVLPQAAKSISEINFRSEAMSIYEGVNNLTITADKDCAFADLTVIDVFGNKVAIDQVTVEGKVATLVLSKSVETFSVIFTNDEGVSEVTIDGFYVNNGPSKAYQALQTTYNTVSALNPVQGDGVGQVSDLEAYDAALAAAEKLLAEGAEDAELEAAKAALEAAQAGLVYNLPKADTDYLILLGLDAIKTNHLTDMAIFADQNSLTADGNVILRWTYVSLTNPEYRWRFIDCGELKWGRPAFYIQSAVTGGYVTRTVESGATIFLSEDSTATRPYDLFFKAGGKVALTDTHWSAGDAALHPNGHGSGAAANKGRNMITWGQHDAASAMYVVEAEKYITDVVYSINGIENIDVTDEFVAPAVKGTFDLFGRRVMTPATTGIYIIDGKKTVVKK